MTKIPKDSDELVWEEPSPCNRGPRGVWVARLAKLGERRGEWARVHECLTPQASASAANQLRLGRLSGVDPTRYEFTSRGRYVYARLLPESERKR